MTRALVRVCANKQIFVAPNIQTISLGMLCYPNVISNSNCNTCKCNSVMFKWVLGYFYSEIWRPVLTDAQMSLNTTARQNVYFRAILTSLTKFINGNLNVSLYWECLPKEREFLNKSFKTCSRTHLSIPQQCVQEEVLRLKPAEWHAGRVPCYTHPNRRTHECTCPERQRTLWCFSHEPPWTLSQIQSF